MGELPTWLSAAASVLALVLSGAGVLISRRASQLQARQITNLEQQNNDRLDAERRETASKVAAWASIGTTDEKPTVRIVHASPTPIYELTVYVTTPFGDFETPYNVHGPRYEPTTLRGATIELQKRTDGHDEARKLVREGRVAVACSFRDASGVWWARLSTGQLHEETDGLAARNRALGTDV
jgi:hypothetical protein